MEKLVFTCLGTFWPHHGDLAYLDHPDGRQARIFVDSIGETWVDIRRIPAGGYFHTERVESYRALNGENRATHELRHRGFGNRRTAPAAHRVVERD